MLLFVSVAAACGWPGAQNEVPRQSGAVPTTGTWLAQPATFTPTDATPHARLDIQAWNQLSSLQPGSTNGPSIATLAVDPITPTTLYAGTLLTATNQTSVYRSDDAGASWQPASEGLPSSSDGTGVEQLAIDPQHSSTLYAIGHFAGLWRSDDRGASWQAAGLKHTRVTALALAPGAPDTLYALTADGLQQSTDAGAHWRSLGAGLPDATTVGFRFLVVDPQQSNVLYLGADFGGVFRSGDGGEHWSAQNIGLPDQPVVEGLALDPQSPATLYVSIIATGLYRSADSGAHWIRASKPEYLALAPAADGALYAILDSTLARSTDRGDTWRTVDEVRCGVQALARTSTGNLLVGCLDGQVYRLQLDSLALAPTTSVPVPAILPLPTAAPGPPALTSVDPPLATDAKTAILNAVHALEQAGPYHITGEIAGAGATSQITGDVVPPDRFHYTIATPSGTIEYLGIGTQGYMKARGAWRASPLSGDDLLQRVEPLRTEVLQGITDTALADTDTVNGVPAQIYTYTFHAENVTTKARLWVATRNGLPVKLETHSQLAGEQTSATQLITYDPQITIDAPPTHE